MYELKVFYNQNIVVTIWIVNYAALPHKSYWVWYHKDSLQRIDTKGGGGGGQGGGGGGGGRKEGGVCVGGLQMHRLVSRMT